jgi:hypothetical protein
LQDRKATVALVNIFNPLPPVETGSRLEPYDLFRLLCPPVVHVAEPAALIERYNRISSAATEPPVLPALPILIDKVVSPLVNAKMAFVAGNPIGTIALCGFVAEMIALILYQMARDDKIIVGIGEAEFERKGQKDRIKILFERDAINQETKGAFDLIREIRRRYLHFITKKHSRVFDDALHVYGKSTWLLVDLVGQEFHSGAWVPKPSFARYLRKHGLL